MINRADATPAPSKLKLALAGVGVLVLLTVAGMAGMAGYEAYTAPVPLVVDAAAQGTRPGKILSREYRILQEQFDLTRQQRAQLGALLSQAASMGADMTHQEYENEFSKLMALREARMRLDQEIEAILTPEQRAAYRARRNVQKEAVQQVLYQVMNNQR